MAYLDLEISLNRSGDADEEGDETGYTVGFRGRRPDSAADVRVGSGLTRFDFSKIQQLETNPPAYGKALADALFSDERVREGFNSARVSAESLNIPLRLRLLIGGSAPRLNSLQWETLRDPRDGSALTANPNLPFSRYLSSPDWRAVLLRGRSQMQALLVAANPADLESYSLTPLDVPGELDQAQAALKQMRVTRLPAAGQRATLENILTHLQQQPCDLLYLVCHGAWVKNDNDTWLWLEDGAGNTARVSGTELTDRLRSLTHRPALVVLASCESADGRAQGSLSALAPRLVDAGIPAVLAMQAKVSLETLGRIMPLFFAELQRHGQIDQALATARAAVLDRLDYWVPALFTRLEDGSIWNSPGFRGEHGEKVEFKKWPSLIKAIRDGKCTPILGPGLYEPLLGSPRQIARRWAEEHGYPLAPYERESLPQVAQYLTISQGAAFPYENMAEILKDELRTRWGDQIPPEYFRDQITLDELITRAGDLLRSRDASDPYQVLAELPLPIYLTATTDNLLARALAEAPAGPQGLKAPEMVLCRWNEHTRKLRNIYKSEPDYYPTPERPLVYHFFGRLDEIDSIVLTEDDYFDFLIGVTHNQKNQPSAVGRVLTDTSLLFLGFQMDDWNFRVLLRHIRSLQGGRRRERDDRVHVSVQIEPEASRIQDLSGAYNYLKEYFYKTAEISVYWGSSHDFIRELKERWDGRTK